MSDTSAMNPVVLAPMTEAPGDGLDAHDRANLVAGFVQRCATLSAGFMTDYFVDDGTAAMVGGPNWKARADTAERAGYWSRAEVAGRPGWLIVKDSDNLFHIRLRDEVQWERQRKRDINNPKLVVPVRLRDGDGCRYCGNIVDWSAGRAARAGTYDHRRPGNAARTPDELVVCCFGCNRMRGGDADADEYLPLMPPPKDPFYGPDTVEFLARRGTHIESSVTAPPATPLDQRPASQAGTAPARPPARPRAKRDTAATQRPATQAGTAQRDPAPSGTPPPPARHAQANEPGNARAQRPAEQAGTARTEPAPTKKERGPAAGGGAPRLPTDRASPEVIHRSAAEPAAKSDSLPQRLYPATGKAGSGRVGTGAALTPARRSRGRRGKRPTTTEQTDDGDPHAS